MIRMQFIILDNAQEVWYLKRNNYSINIYNLYISYIFKCVSLLMSNKTCPKNLNSCLSRGTLNFGALAFQDLFNSYNLNFRLLSINYNSSEIMIIHCHIYSCASLKYSENEQVAYSEYQIQKQKVIQTRKISKLLVNFLSFIKLFPFPQLEINISSFFLCGINLNKGLKGIIKKELLRYMSLLIVQGYCFNDYDYNREYHDQIFTQAQIIGHTIMYIGDIIFKKFIF
ncbi:hypothetical protein pb186bvf_002427 [Paramecium bursaria]